MTSRRRLGLALAVVGRVVELRGPLDHVHTLGVDAAELDRRMRARRLERLRAEAEEAERAEEEAEEEAVEEAGESVAARAVPA